MTADTWTAPPAERLDVVRALQPFEETFSGLVALKSLTSELVGRFVMPAIHATREAAPPTPSDPIMRRHRPTSERSKSSAGPFTRRSRMRTKGVDL